MCSGDMHASAPRVQFDGWKRRKLDPASALHGAAPTITVAQRILDVHVGNGRSLPACEAADQYQQIAARATTEHLQRLRTWRQQADQKLFAHRATVLSDSDDKGARWGTPAAVAPVLSRTARDDQGNLRPPSTCECKCCARKHKVNGVSTDAEGEVPLPCARPNSCGKQECASKRGCQHRVQELWTTMHALAGQSKDALKSVTNVWVTLTATSDRVPWLRAIIAACGNDDSPLVMAREQNEPPSAELNVQVLLTTMHRPGSKNTSKKAAELLKRVLRNAVPPCLS